MHEKFTIWTIFITNSLYCRKLVEIKLEYTQKHECDLLCLDNRTKIGQGALKSLLRFLLKYFFSIVHFHSIYDCQPLDLL